jgi:hypothetical protein
MKYPLLRSEIQKLRPSGINTTCGDVWIIGSKTTWNGRAGVFLFPQSWGVQDRVAFELFHLPSKDLKISALVRGNAGTRLCRLLENFTFDCDPFTHPLNVHPSKVKISTSLTHNSSYLFRRVIGSYLNHQHVLAAHDVICLLSTKSPWMDAVCCFVKRTYRVLRNTSASQDLLPFIP